MISLRVPSYYWMDDMCFQVEELLRTIELPMNGFSVEGNLPSP